MTDSLSTIRHSIMPNDESAPCQPCEIYRSSNGDVWELIRAGAADQHMVRHTPTPSSGGQISLVTIEQFLAVKSTGPEHAALRILLRASEQQAAEQ
jgi:hypothetical protein